jgi:[protein-PII] uridylyltransferase
LRDVQLLDALAIAQLADRLAVSWPDSQMGSLSPTHRAHLTLLNVRTELHRVSGRGHDLLLAQYADEISAALHIGDRHDLSRMVSDAGWTISYQVDAGHVAANLTKNNRGLISAARELMVDHAAMRPDVGDDEIPPVLTR